MKLFTKYRSQCIVTIALALLLFVFYSKAPATFGNSIIYRSFLTTIPPITLVSLGLTFLIIMGQMDLSFPAISALAAFVFAKTLFWSGSQLLALLFALLSGLAAGAVNGLLVAYVGMPSMIATIGTQFVWRGFLLLASAGLAIPLAQFSNSWSFTLFAGRIGNWMFPVQALWAIGGAIFSALLLNRHPFGEAALFVGDNPSTSGMMGLSVKKTTLFGFILMGFFSALAGLVSTFELANWWPTQGDGILLLAFAAVFVGGTRALGGKGTIYGTFIGSIIIGIIEAGIVAAGLTGFWTRFIHGLVIIVSVALYSVLNRKR